MNRQCVYKISHIDSGRAYIGSSVNAEQRKITHFSTLRKRKHSNYRLQAAWDLYGESRFEFSVIEDIDDKETMLTREAFWIKELNSFVDGYNITPTPAGGLRAGSGRKQEPWSNEHQMLRVPKIFYDETHAFLEGLKANYKGGVK